MATLIRTCRKCGAKIFSNAPEGLCTGCALESALGMFSDAVSGRGESASVEYPQSIDAVSYTHLTLPTILRV